MCSVLCKHKLGPRHPAAHTGISESQIVWVKAVRGCECVNELLRVVIVTLSGGGPPPVVTFDIVSHPLLSPPLVQNSPALQFQSCSLLSPFLPSLPFPSFCCCPPLFVFIHHHHHHHHSPVTAAPSCSLSILDSSLLYISPILNASCNTTPIDNAHHQRPTTTTTILRSTSFVPHHR